MVEIVTWLRRTLFVWLGVTLVALAAPGYADDTNQMGSQGGSPFDVQCKGADLLIGVSYIAGRDVDQVSPICQPRKGGSFTGGEYRLGQFGGRTDNSVAGALRCPFNMAIRSMHIYVDNQAQIHRFSLTCYPASSDIVQPVYLKGVVNPPGGGGVDQSGGNVSCPVGELAKGMTGGNTSSVNRLGLKCGTFEKTAVNNGDNTGGGNTGGGNTRTVKGSTTIYTKPEGSEIAYLNDGDAVTIVSCEDGGQGWCKISSPKKGYVWGGDLNQ